MVSIKSKIYSMLPKNMQKKTKSFYYDSILYPINKLKNKIKYGESDFFDTICIETTTHCNLRCDFCPNKIYERGTLKNKKLMDEELFKKIINQLAEVKFKGTIMPHFYGEPLTDERLTDWVSYIKEKLPKSRIEINSNGILLTPEIYKQLINAGADSFTISQYTPEMTEGMKQVFEYLKKRPKENKINYRVFKEDTAICNRGGEIEVKKPWEKPLCTYPINFINIDYNGNMVICCNDYHSSIKLGNLNQERLIDIWFKPYYKNLRKSLRKGVYDLLICKRCVGEITS
ncbi:MAG: radical SAM/SPASM domain-containing protein [archaeon]